MTIGSEQQIHMMHRVAGVAWCPTWYVADLPGHDGLKPVAYSKSCWGWTDDRKKAIDLSIYWQRRFLADRAKVGRHGFAKIETA